MILKAGTYVLNNPLTIVDTDIFNVELNFTSKIVDTENGVDANISCTEVYVIGASAEGNAFEVPTVIYKGVTSDVEISDDYVVDGQTFAYLGEFPLESLRTITLETDQTVDDYFGNGFILNTNYNEVNKATITLKAGTYRFNDVLSLTTLYEIPLNFSFYSLSVEINGKLVEGDILCTGIRYIQHNSEEDFKLSFKTDDSWLQMYTNFNPTTTWKTSYYGEGIKTISVLEDTEVDTDSYTWFTTNTVPMLPVSGCYQWNETMQVPEKSIKQKVNFRYYKGSVRNAGALDIARISNGDAGDYLGMSASVDIDVWDGTEEGLHDGGGWYGPYEQTRLIDFGDEPQLVSQPFYDYLTANSVKTNWDDHFRTISGRWKWKDKITYSESSCQIEADDNVIGIAPADELGFNGMCIVYMWVSYEGTLNYDVMYADEFGGWVDGIIVDSETGNVDTTNVVLSDRYQTWDFGEGCYILASVYNYIVENADPVISKKFTRLYIGDVAAKGISKQFRKLTTEKPAENVIEVTELPTTDIDTDKFYLMDGEYYRYEESSDDDSLLGTWELHPVKTTYGYGSGSIGGSRFICHNKRSNKTYYGLYTYARALTAYFQFFTTPECTSERTASFYSVAYTINDGYVWYGSTTMNTGDIVEFTEVSKLSADFLTWWKIHATKIANSFTWVKYASPEASTKQT